MDSECLLVNDKSWRRCWIPRTLLSEEVLFRYETSFAVPHKATSGRHLPIMELGTVRLAPPEGEERSDFVESRFRY